MAKCLNGDEVKDVSGISRDAFTGIFLPKSLLFLKISKIFLLSLIFFLVSHLPGKEIKFQQILH